MVDLKQMERSRKDKAKYGGRSSLKRKLYSKSNLNKWKRSADSRDAEKLDSKFGDSWVSTMANNDDR